ncbi:hypothetical protein PQU63_03590 [Xanthomonas protegens]|uniref:Uncharacterized protein n=1 Tax=Xanthomonas protegens TaxID=3380705 RepID=A0ABU9L7C7_9XANT
MEELSAYERRAIETIAASDQQRDVILAQLATSKCASRNYTGVGLYTDLVVDSCAALLDQARWKIEDMPKGHAQHPELPDGAGLILWIKDGYISRLESYTYVGSWPQDESLFRLAIQ